MDSVAPCGHVRKALPELHGKGRRVRVASVFSKNLEDNAKRHAGSIGSTQVAVSEPVPDGIVWTSASSTAWERHLDECGSLH